MFRIDHFGTIMIDRKGSVRIVRVNVIIIYILLHMYLYPVRIHMNETLTHSHEKQLTTKQEP